MAVNRAGSGRQEDVPFTNDCQRLILRITKDQFTFL